MPSVTPKRRNIAIATAIARVSLAALLLLPLMSPRATMAADAGHLAAARLRCENLTNPLGVDLPQPRLSWIVTSAERGQRQTAYQVLVAGDAASLAADRGELWDSGKIDNAGTIAIAYAGKPLTSYQRCHWKVRVWDQQGNASAWSQPAVWIVGLLEAGEWKAEWIGSDKLRQVKTEQPSLDGAKWICFPAEGTPPAGSQLLVTTWTLPADIVIKRAELTVTADDACKFVINSELVATHQSWSSAKIVDVTSRLKPGVNSLRCEIQNGAPGPTGLIAKLIVTAGDGKTLTLVTDGSWKSTGSPGENWHNRDLDTSTWPNSQVLGDFGVAPWGKVSLATLTLPPPVYLRTKFELTKPVKSALLSASGLGIFDLHLNGRRVSDDLFDPGWTDYTKRVYYRTYDVTELVRQGNNAWGAVLADGWYSGYVGFGKIRNHYGSKPRFGGQLHVEFTDGTTQTIQTGPNWKAATGPILEADFLMGEAFDARLAKSDWDQPQFDDQTWDNVDTGAELKPVVSWHPGPAVRSFQELKPQKTTEPQPGTWVFDMGRNFAGMVRLAVSGKPGQKLTLRFAERLNPDGTIYTTNLREARATDTYTCLGAGPETWQPRFTFHGFQYVELTGLESAPTADTITGVAISSDTPVVGRFASSDEMLNTLHGNIYWTQRANFIDIPTDCPQRDERLGWTGDAQVYVRTATLNADVEAFFTKWLVDLDDGQRADGQFPMVAPVKVANDDGGPAWADAGVICPWTIYEVYGDRRILEQHYPAMKRFVEFCVTRSTPELLPPAQYHAFGDWLSIGADTPREIIYTAYFAQSTRLLARASEVLGKAEDAAKYRAQYDQIKQSFNKAYVADDGRIRGDTQTCYVLALAFDLLDDAKASQAAAHLVADIEKHDWHLSTGFIGTKDLMLVLAKIGRNDVAYRLIHNDTFPSWGFSIKQGATSIWERWDGWTPEKGFQDAGMNSFAHYSFGAVYQWMVENIGGIRSDGPAYEKLVIAPQPGGKLTWAKVGYESVRGPIESSWKLEDGKFSLDVTLPPGATATVMIPAVGGQAVTEGGQLAGKGEGVKFVRRERHQAVVEVGSGTYHFEVSKK
jgi:alpha-L-rhamnosidase